MGEIQKASAALDGCGVGCGQLQDRVNSSFSLEVEGAELPEAVRDNSATKGEARSRPDSRARKATNAAMRKTRGVSKPFP